MFERKFFLHLISSILAIYASEISVKHGYKLFLDTVFLNLAL